MAKLFSITARWINRLLRPAGFVLQKTTFQIQDQFSMAAGLSLTASLLPDVRTVIDLGAARGEWTALARPHFPAATFHLIEPLIEQKAALIKLHQRFPNTCIYHCAAGPNDGQVDLTVSKDLDGSGVYGSTGGHGEQRIIPQRSLDSLMAEANASGPFVIKFDTHGYELPILQGAEKTLKQCVLLIIEVYNFKISPSSLYFWELCSHLHSVGFRPAFLADPYPRKKDGLLWQMDFFFVRTDLPEIQSNTFDRSASSLR